MFITFRSYRNKFLWVTVMKKGSCVIKSFPSNQIDVHCSDEVKYWKKIKACINFIRKRQKKMKISERKGVELSLYVKNSLQVPVRTNPVGCGLSRNRKNWWKSRFFWVTRYIQSFWVLGWVLFLLYYLLDSQFLCYCDILVNSTIIATIFRWGKQVSVKILSIKGQDFEFCVFFILFLKYYQRIFISSWRIKNFMRCDKMMRALIRIYPQKRFFFFWLSSIGIRIIKNLTYTMRKPDSNLKMSVKKTTSI